MRIDFTGSPLSLYEIARTCQEIDHFHCVEIEATARPQWDDAGQEYMARREFLTHLQIRRSEDTIEIYENTNLIARDDPCVQTNTWDRVVGDAS